MEAVLDLYTAAHDPAEPLIAMDESSVQLLADVHAPQPIAPGRPRRQDDQYQRKGVRAPFMFFDPLGGWRRVTGGARRTKADWAREVRRLLDRDYPDARRVHLLCDNLNVHHESSFYEAFAPAEARRLLDRLTIHYTPKHGSWLNVAEVELSAMARQCLGDRRCATAAELDAELLAWNAARNLERVGVLWRFTTADARIRLRHLYPPI